MNHFLRFLKEKQRRAIGWDEIFESGIDKDAIIMLWRGSGRGVEPVKVLKAGHDVIFSPETHCYFDVEYEQISIQKTYSYEPIDESITGELANHVLGVQANMWTHIATNEVAMDMQIFPRLTALSEVAWSPGELRDWKDFKKRLVVHCKRLDKLGVNYYHDYVIWKKIRQ